jgi:glycosyltransferase involved in cell wall biosynthesis
MREKNMNNRVSLIMSVYNGSSFLEQSISSVLGQTFSNFEFIIVDDASTDNSLEIITNFAEKDPRIKVLRNSCNLGLTKSLNLSLKVCSGEYVARIDADDFCAVDRLEKQIKFLDQNDKYVLVSSWAVEVDSSGNEIRVLKPNLTDSELKKVLIRHNPIIHSSIMFRRQIVLSEGGYDEYFVYAQDYDLYLRLVKNFSLAILPECLVFSRVSANSITVRKNRRQTFFALVARHRAIINKTYEFRNYIYLFFPLIGTVLSPGIKRRIKLFLYSDH